MGNLIAKFRPQIFLAICVLGLAAGLGMKWGYNEVATAAIAGVIALGKDLLNAEIDK